MPLDNYGWFTANESYDSIIARAGNVILSEAIGDYQGDLVYVINDDTRYGFQVTGYGSCSGCDALEACESDNEVEELAQALIAGIHWFNYLETLKTYVSTLDKSWYYYEDEWQEILEKILAL